MAVDSSNFFQKWKKIVEVNTVGTLNVTSVIFPLMAGRKFGHVVNISSVCVSWLGLVVQIIIYILFHRASQPLRTMWCILPASSFWKGFSQGLRREGQSQAEAYY